MSTNSQLFGGAVNMLQQRTEWEAKQKLYYQMRHDGLRRRKKPFPDAADLHFPEIDMAIRRLKPFWMGQVMSGDRLAQFTSMQEQLDTVTDAAADYYDFVTKQRSRFLRKFRVVEDTMLLRGRGVLKCWADPFEDYALIDEAVDPLYLIVPDSANELTDADEFVHVRLITPAQYRRDRRMQDQSEATLNRLIGSSEFQNYSTIALEKRVREGITHNRSPNGILIWDHYTKTSSGWNVSTYSPQNPDVWLRDDYPVVYRAAGKPSLPFFSFAMEIKDEGWYSPRGLGELLAPVESYLCKLWNEKADYMTFSNRPVFTAEGEIQNVANIRWQPGEFIPRNVKAVQMAAPTLSFDQELMFGREIAEQQSQSPDFGIAGNGAGGSKPRTATENQRISALQEAGVNDNAGFFREDLGKVHVHRWALLCQFRPKDFSYYATGKIGTLPETALHEQYLIAPDGSPDGWNRMMRFQKAASRLQLWKGDPNCDQDKLKRDVMAADDAVFAQRAFLPSGMAQGKEAEDEAMEIVILAQGFPAQVTPGEDHATRIMVDLGWLEKQAKTGVPVDPIAKKNILEHMVQHFQYLKQTNPDAAKQIGALVMMVEKQAQQPQPQPVPAGMPMGPGQGAGVPPAGPGPEQPPAFDGLRRGEQMPEGGGAPSMEVPGFGVGRSS